jgi:thiol-disulfide isomerase/thioredoxin
MRTGTVIAWLALLFAGIIALFWHNEWVYSLPTPVPASYKIVSRGDDIRLTAQLDSLNNKPLLLHFFNPDCPCSRFNIDHFRSLVKQYGNKINFAMIVMSNKEYSVKEIQDKYEVNIPVIFDTTLAASCGVYSTPQAVIIDTTHKLYYRGNYNKGRYCTNQKTEYARMALDALLNKMPALVFDRFALKAYGCKLPGCNIIK